MRSRCGFALSSSRCCNAVPTEFAESAGDDDRAAGAALAEFGDQRRNSFGWCRDDGEVGGLRQAGNRRVDPQTLDLLVVRAHQHQVAMKAGAVQVAHCNCADRTRPRRRADQGNRFCRENLVEVANRHWPRLRR